MKKKSFRGCKNRFMLKLADNFAMSIESDIELVLHLSNQYLIYGCVDSFNQFLHEHTNYDELLDSVQDYETSALKPLLQQRARDMIRMS